MKKKINFSDHFFVAGSRGMVGSSICKALRKNGYGEEINKGRILTPSKEDLDLCNAEEVQKWFDSYRPSVVILAAAKVGGIFANSSEPSDFILKILKFKLTLLKLLGNMG